MYGVVGFLGGVFGFFVQAAILAAVVLLAIFIKYNQDRQVVDEVMDKSFAEYIPVYIRKKPITIGVTILAFLIGKIFAGLIVFVIGQGVSLKPKSKSKIKLVSKAQLRRRAAGFERDRVAALGATHRARAQAIEAIYEARTATEATECMVEWTFRAAGENADTEGYVFFEVERNLAVMDAREREHLKIVDLLISATEAADDTYLCWRGALLWADGKGNGGDLQWRATEANGAEAVNEGLRRRGLTVNQVIGSITQHLNRLAADPGTSPELAMVAKEFGERVSMGGAGWLRASDIPNTEFRKKSDYALTIGRLQDGTPLTYSGEGSMITIAPPGSGKTQCNVFPNLLSWDGPAVILDISGDIYEKTARRRAEFGPVYRFSPLDPANSHAYNPLTFVRSDPDFIWEDASLLAEMMIVPGSGTDQFWESHARTALTSAIAYVCYANKPESRPMHAVLDITYGGKAWEDMLFGLRTAIDVRAMVRQATAYDEMEAKTISSVLLTVRASLSAWSGERIARTTARSDWSPLDLRKGSPTVYIVMRLNEVEAYLSLLRVFIGQHIRILTAGDIPPRGAAPILFMLDELPRLKNMPPVDEALNVGRKFGLRLWMFAQSVGQMKNAYENAEGMMSACIVRIFMNPSGADGLAEKLSEEIGYVDSLADGSRRKLVEAADLAGGAFKDLQIVLSQGARPARVTKDFAYDNPAMKAQMDGPAPEAAE